ncbi:MAG: branched chain amino acid aminotransferase [Candidatus Marinimicrobia bacterium]|nr:branched chain amino acid aminotransferase [Candidatus Neomarinimicrobiota bacterium]
MMLKKKNIDWDTLGFDPIETRSMFIAKCPLDGEWTNGSLIPYGNIELSPAAGVLNYGQGVFEGTKAYHTSKDNIVLFRIQRNAKRMAWSTKRLCIPEMNSDFFINAVTKTVKDNIDYIPPYGKGSLYVRPIVWGTAPALGVKAVSDYTFMVFVSPVGSYFKKGMRPLNLKVETDYHRAAPRGIGNAKAIGNYSASLYPLTMAKKQGFDEVIYLDSIDGERIEELGSANLFICKDGVLKTPKLSGSILDGVTRNSVCRIASEILDIQVEETDILLKDMLEADEVFCTGTAVIVAPVGQITFKNKIYEFGYSDIGPIAKKCKETLTALQRQEISDPFGWLKTIAEEV